MLFVVPAGGKRSEVSPTIPPNVEGSQLWVHDVSDLRGLPATTGTWQLVLQWQHAGPSGSPPQFGNNAASRTVTVTR